MRIPASPYRSMLPIATQAVSQVAQTAPGAAIPGGLAYLYRTRGKSLKRRDPALFRLAQSAHRLAQGDVRMLPRLLHANHARIAEALKSQGLGNYFNYFAAQSRQMPGFREFVAHGPWAHMGRLQRRGHPGPLGPPGFQIPPDALRRMVGMQSRGLQQSLGVPYARSLEMSRQMQYASPMQKIFQFLRGANIPLEELLPLADYFKPQQGMGGRRG